MISTKNNNINGHCLITAAPLPVAETITPVTNASVHLITTNNLQHCKQQPKSSISTSSATSFFHRLYKRPFIGHRTIIPGGSEKCSCDCVQCKSTSELKNVQSLKHFWINAFGGGTNINKTSSCPTCSIHCAHAVVNLKSATLRPITTVPSDFVPDITRATKCRSLDRNVQPPPSQLLLNDPNHRVQCANVVSSPVYKSSIDNFYKYKTADLVKNNRISDIHSHCGGDWVREMKSLSPPSSTSPSSTNDQESIIIAKDCENASVNEDRDDCNNSKYKMNIPHCKADDLHNHNDDDHCTEKNDQIVLLARNNESNDKHTILSENQANLCETTTPIIIRTTAILTMAADKNREKNNDVAYGTIIPTTTTTKISDKITQANISNRNSTTNSSTSSLASSESPRKNVNNNSSSRKCSFRTNNVHHYYHLQYPHRHHYYKKNASITVMNGSKVAALTHRFNQLIQQDADILAEIKRNKEMVLHRSGGHIFKVKETDSEETLSNRSGSGGISATPRKQRTPSRGKGDQNNIAVTCGSRVIRKKSNVKRKSSIKSNKSVRSVKDPVERPECDSSSVIITVDNIINAEQTEKIIQTLPGKMEKPKVPDKSAEVLQRTKEIVKMNSLKRMKTVNRSSTNELNNEKNDDQSINRGEKRHALENITEVIEEKDDKIEVSITSAQIVESYNGKAINNDNQSMLGAIIDQEMNEVKTKKSRYTRLYEKLRFKSPFSGIGRKLPQPTGSAINQQQNKEHKEPIYSVPEQKIVDAICSVNNRIEHLSSKSEISLIKSHDLSDYRDNQYQRSPINNDKTTANSMKPNISFLFRTHCKPLMFNSSCEISSNYIDNNNDHYPVAEAINQVVISKTRSMDEVCFPTSDVKSKLLQQISLEEKNFSAICKRTDDLLSRLKDPTCIEDGGYEIIRSQNDMTDNRIIKDSEPIESFVHKEYQKIHLTNDGSGGGCGSDESTGNVNNNQSDKSATDSSIIYQSISEAISTEATINKDDCDSLNSYESFENYEAVDELRSSQSDTVATAYCDRHIENGYELCCDTVPPEPPPPRKLSVDQQKFKSHDTVNLQSNPQIPLPKRNLQNIHAKLLSSSSIDVIHSNYEKITYEMAAVTLPQTALLTSSTPPPPPPIRPPKSPHLSVNSQQPHTPSAVTLCDSRSIDSEYRDYDYGENIYDTIKAVDGSGSSVIDYESIKSVNFLRNDRNGMKHSDSMSTLSSDVKTNSLYGTTIDGRRSGISPPSESISGSSDNSDEWIDISDGEGDRKHKFIVICERKKIHRSPDWNRNRMLNDQRNINNQQHEQEEYYDDDSDHYYESLDTAENVKNSNAKTLPITSTNDNHDGNKDDNHIQTIIHDDFDSFDSDDYSDEDVRKNDSGVDVSNTRLPDPPTQTSQVYSFMQKIKNFGSISKSLTKLTKRKSSTVLNSQQSNSSIAIPTMDINQPKQKYENTQFYVQNDYQNVAEVTTKSRIKSKTKSMKMLRKKNTPADPYENTEFHSPRTTLITQINHQQPQSSDQLLSASSPTLPSHNNGSTSRIEIGTNSSSSTPRSESEILSRKKSKSSKSFKSKFRKNFSSIGDHHDHTINLGSSLNGNRSTFYVTDSVDVDSGIFNSTDRVPTTSTDDLQTGDVPASLEQSHLLDHSTNTTVTRRSPSILDSKSPEINRRSRRSSLGMRPNNPPPPPPVDMKKIYKSKRLGTTSWYAECGVFKSDALSSGGVDGELGINVADGIKESKKDGREAKSTSSWYADAGLYQTTSGVSVASSSGSSGVSTGGECGPGDDNSHSMFLNEPLYQIYSQAKLESLTKDIGEFMMDNENNSDGYEEIGVLAHATSGEDEELAARKPQRPTALQLVGPKQGPSRTLWSEIPEVINSQILSTLTPTEKRLQEAKFEILTSEASYLKSLTLLRTHFMNHPAFRDTAILPAADRKILFSYIVSVQECSDKLLCDLENCWQDNIMLLGLSRNVYKHAEKYFHVYVTYCEHQGKLDRTLKRLKEAKSTFAQALDTLESDPLCCGLSLHSFLMLPMQRITRLPLLVDAVLSKLKLDDDEFDNWKMTLAILNKIVGQCNDAANRSEQAFELENLARQIEFPSHIRPLAIVPVGVPAAGIVVVRSLVRRGELCHLIWRGDDAGKLTFGKKFAKINVYAFLFTDLLVLTKKQRTADDAFTVIDYCPRSLLTVSSGDIIPQLPAKELLMGGKHLIFMTLLENHEGKMVEMILACSSETERQRWLHATEPPESENPDEKLYEQWDCPQVVVKHTYVGNQPDELCLDPGDVVNVTRKMADGWFHGERIRDGAHGWFPGNYAEEVASTHVRARNLKQRYRLLTFTAAYWESQKSKK